MANVTHEEIYQALKGECGAPTYVVANKLRMKHQHHRPLDTAKVLRKMKVMERQGHVERVPSCYKVMICWRTVPTF